MPVELILRNPNPQSITLKMIPPMATAPKCFAVDKCPINMRSTALSIGTDMLLAIFGIAKRRISLFMYSHIFAMWDSDESNPPKLGESI